MSFPRPLLPALSLLLLTQFLFASLGRADQVDWSGQWNTFWRQGIAVMTLHQDGDTVTGTFEPGGGEIEAEVQGSLLRGRWSQPGSQGGFLFAIADNGQTFTGRYDSGEYWNGKRSDDLQTNTARFTATFTPRETLRTVVAAANDAILGRDATAARFIEPNLLFEDGEQDARARLDRTRLFWQILNLNTFRIYQAPERPAGDTAEFTIAPTGGSVSYTLRFRADDTGNWKIVVEPLADLLAARNAILADLGYETYFEALAARQHSPRGTMRAFLEGMRDWDHGGEERAMAALDLSAYPPRLQGIEGPIVADYLRQIIDRAGYVIWQEIPNDTDMPTAYVHYRHPLGSVVIARALDADGNPGPWKFTAETLASAPDLFGAIQDMPIAAGLATAEPITEFFKLRQPVHDISPILLERPFILENWQWIALLAACIVAVLLGWLSTWLLRVGFLPFTNDDNRAGLKSARDSLKRPLWFAATAVLFLVLLANLGLLHSGLGYGPRMVGLFAVIGVVVLAYRIVSLVGSVFVERAEKTPGYVDEIVTSLAIGLVKLVMIVLGLFVAADVVGLPYEGVITGLGVGGIALAFAARDTVSNMLSGAILMADRPFKRGDLVAAGGELATVENVGLRSTRMRTLDDSLLVIPNAQLVDQAIVNWGQRRKRKLLLGIGLTYDTPRAKLDEFCTRLRDLYMDQPPSDKTTCYIGLKGFGASSIDIELWGYFVVSTYSAHVEATHALVGDIVDLAAEVGVSFAFPTRTIHLEPAGEEPAPSQLLPAAAD